MGSLVRPVDRPNFFYFPLVNKMYKKSRLWCFTNYRLDFDYEKLIKACKVKYLLYGKESCPKTGRIHHQGYLWLKTQCGSIKTMANMFDKGTHVEMCHGSWDENCKYCVKDDNVSEFGEAPKQGARGDIKKNIEMIMSGDMGAEDFVDLDPVHYHMYGRTLHKAEDIALRKKFRKEMTTCEWLWGPTGTGKSHRAFKDFDPETHYVWKNEKEWQDGYTGQEIVIINELRGDTLRFGKLLQLIDKWPYYLERRRREPVPFIAKHIIITSALPPEEIFVNLAEDDRLDQLYRRIVVTHVSERCAQRALLRSDQGVILGP